MTRTARTRTRAARDSGLSLIETVVALGVVTVVLVAFGTLLIGTQRAVTADGTRSTARTLAAEQIEVLRRLPWSAVGLYPTDPGYQITSNGEPTVAVTTLPRATGAPVPTRTLTRGGVVYTVRTDVTWRKDPAHGVAAPTGTEYNYKRLRVRVSWPRNGGADRDVTLENYRAPNSDELAPPAAAPVPPPPGPAPDPYQPKSVTCVGGSATTLSGIALNPQDPAVVKVTPLGYSTTGLGISYTGLSPSKSASGYPRVVRVADDLTVRTFTSSSLSVPAYTELGKPGRYTVVVQNIPRTGLPALRTCTYEFLYLEPAPLPPSSRTPPPPDSQCFGPTDVRWPIETVVTDKTTIQLDGAGNTAEPFTITYTGLPPEEQDLNRPLLSDLGPLSYSSKYGAEARFNTYSLVVPIGRGPVPAGRQLIEVFGINPLAATNGFGLCRIAVNFAAAAAAGPVTIEFQGVYARGFSEPSNDQLLPANQQNIFVEPETTCLDSWTNQTAPKKWAVPQLWRRPDSGGRFTPVLRYRITGLGGGSGGIPEVLTTDTDYGPIPLAATSDPEIFYLIPDTNFAANQQRFLCQEESSTPRGQAIFNSATTTFSVRAYRASDGQFATDSRVIPIRRTWCYLPVFGPCLPPPYPLTD